MLDTLEQYAELTQELITLSPQDKRVVYRRLARTDLWFLLVYILRCDYMLDKQNPQWLLDRCKEVQSEPNEHLDLWAREHFKSTIITFGKTIQDVLASHGDDPLPEWKGIEVTVGIFSFVRSIAKSILRQIMREFENNELLQDLFDDILYKEPRKQAPKWSEDDGIVVRRKSNPKEATIEAWGLIDGQPVSKHFRICVYDDIVSNDNVKTSEGIQNVNRAWELSINLGVEGGFRRYIGTRYVPMDTYQLIMSRNAAKPRLYPATDDGTPTGKPVLITETELKKKYNDMGESTFFAQMLQNPISDELQAFKPEWVHHYDNTSAHFSCRNMNVFILYDPANEKKKREADDPDYTAMMVLGLAPDNNYYLLDMVRDRLNPTERINLLIKLHKRWNAKSGRPPKVICEQYGMMTDAFYLKKAQDDINYRFPLIKVGGNMKKEDRIKRLVPIFQQGRFYLPKIIFYDNVAGERVELVRQFIEDELMIFPRKGYNSHDDMLDALSRIMDQDVSAVFPRIEKKELGSEDYGTRPSRDNTEEDFVNW